MKRLFPYLALAIVLGLTVAAGVIQGRLSNRWGQPAELLAAAEKLAAVPKQFGGWELQSQEALSPEVRAELQCAGYLNRTYLNRTTGQSVNVAVLVGPPGPTSVHTPEICYSSREYEQTSDSKRFEIAGPAGRSDVFWGLSFRAHTVMGDVLRVGYAWSDGGPWQAPDQPRIRFGARPVLYKIQLAGRMPPGGDAQPADPCAAFLRDFVPVLDRFLLKPQTD
ncbi:MAG: exosortase-associated EpsI family protein [Pirellulales bacterium]